MKSPGQLSYWLPHIMEMSDYFLNTRFKLKLFFPPRALDKWHALLTAWYQVAILLSLVAVPVLEIINLITCWRYTFSFVIRNWSARRYHTITWIFYSPATFDPIVIASVNDLCLTQVLHRQFQKKNFLILQFLLLLLIHIFCLLPPQKERFLSIFPFSIYIYLFLSTSWTQKFLLFNVL